MSIPSLPDLRRFLEQGEHLLPGLQELIAYARPEQVWPLRRSIKDLRRVVLFGNRLLSSVTSPQSLYPLPPRVVCLCGSTRFEAAFRDAERRLAHEDGVIVLSVSSFQRGGELGDELKLRLDHLHKRKIDLADEVLVLNVNGYIGESTRGEIAYARSTGVPVRYLEDPAEEAPLVDDHTPWPS